jgi:hypothetical protein
MTGAEHSAQRARVEASLLADEQREHHHDVYTSRRLAMPGPQDGDGARASAPPASRTAGAAAERVAAAEDSAHECPACHGEGEVAFNDGWPDPQGADSMRCGDCGGTGVAPTATRSHWPTSSRGRS